MLQPLWGGAGIVLVKEEECTEAGEDLAAAWTYVVVCGLSCLENIVAAGPCAVTVCVLQLAIDEDLTSLCLCNGFLPH